MVSKSNPDTMYYHQATHEADAKQFKALLQKEIRDEESPQQETLGFLQPRKGTTREQRVRFSVVNAKKTFHQNR